MDPMDKKYGFSTSFCPEERFSLKQKIPLYYEVKFDIFQNPKKLCRGL
jgi:hypothetical protein